MDLVGGRGGTVAERGGGGMPGGGEEGAPYRLEYDSRWGRASATKAG